MWITMNRLFLTILLFLLTGTVAILSFSHFLLWGGITGGLNNGTSLFMTLYLFFFATPFIIGICNKL
jgi:hypothetical protein